MKYLLFPLLCVCMLMAGMDSQAQVNKCAADEVFQQWLSQNPAAQQKYEAEKKALQQASQNPTQANPKVLHDRSQLMMSESEMESMIEEPETDEIVIPIVVHVIAPMPGHPANISRAQIENQIDILNKEFAEEVTTYNLYYPPVWEKVYSADTRIRFCLADKDPKGNPHKE